MQEQQELKKSDEKEEYYRNLLKQMPIEEIPEFEKYSTLISYYRDNYDVSDMEIVRVLCVEQQKT